MSTHKNTINASNLQVLDPETDSEKRTNGNHRNHREQKESTLLTDAGNATRFVLSFGQDVRYVPDWKKWLIYRDGVWQVDRSLATFRMGELTVRSIYHEAGDTEDTKDRKALAAWGMKCETETRINGLLNIAKARPGVPVRPEELDADQMLLNVQNGTIDLRTGQLRDHNHADLITKQAPVRFDPDATAPLFEAFLAQIIPSAEVRGYLQKAIGYSLTGLNIEQVMFFCFGAGANGKSTLTSLIGKLLGDYAKVTPSSTLMAKSNDAIPNDVARLQGVRFVSANETEDGRKLAEASLKAMTGDQKITARFMRAEFFEFTPVMKIWLSTNHRPRINGTDNGIWRRIRLIPFSVTIPPEQQDKNLYDKLVEELPGILNWAIAGCLLWQREGLGEPKEVMAATQAYRADMDTLNDFLGECCVIEGNARTTAKELYLAYKDWCEANGEKAESQKQFGMKLAEKRFDKTKTSIMYYIGLRLRTEDDPREEGRDEDRHSALTPETAPRHEEIENTIPNPPSIPTPVIPEQPEHMKRLHNGMRVHTTRGDGRIWRCWDDQVAVEIDMKGTSEFFRTPFEKSCVVALPGEYERFFPTAPGV